MHVSFLCFASYYIPDFACCRPKFIFHAVSLVPRLSCRSLGTRLSRGKLSSSLNTCSVELPGGVVTSKMASSTKHSTSK